jgi:zinc transporter 9
MVMVLSAFSGRWVSACGIFFLGAGVTIFHGTESLSHPVAPQITFFIYFILALSFIIESFTLYKAYQEIYVDREETFRENMTHADPISLAVFYEDTVAVLGIIVASFSIIISNLTGNHMFDAFGSIVIGALLAIVAGVLLNTNRKIFTRQIYSKRNGGGDHRVPRK